MAERIDILEMENKELRDLLRNEMQKTINLQFILNHLRKERSIRYYLAVLTACFTRNREAVNQDIVSYD